MTPPPAPSRWRRRFARWGAFAAVLAILYLTRGWTLPAWGRWLDVSEPPRSGDYAYVLGGDADSRPFVAAGLYKRGLVGLVLVPGVHQGPQAEEVGLPRHTDLIRQVLIVRGVPADRVVTLPGEATSTADEALALAVFLDARPEATVAVVTNDFHSRRARRTFRRALGDRAGQVYFVATPTDGVTADTWWHTPGGFTTYLGETFKLAYHAARD